MRERSAVPAGHAAPASRLPTPGPPIPIRAQIPGSGVQLRLALRLPRHDAGAVGVTRRVLDAALSAMGVNGQCRSDIAIALTEACANAVAHAQLGDDYQVAVRTQADECVIEVSDTGIGLDLDRTTAGPPELTAESGRGFQVIRACTDHMELRAVRPHGLAIRMVKILAWEPTATWAESAGVR